MGLTLKTSTFCRCVVYNPRPPCHAPFLGVPLQGCPEWTSPNPCLGKFLSLDTQGTHAMKCLYYTANHASAIWPPGRHVLPCGWCALSPISALACRLWMGSILVGLKRHLCLWMSVGIASFFSFSWALFKCNAILSFHKLFYCWQIDCISWKRWFRLKCIRIPNTLICQLFSA